MLDEPSVCNPGLEYPEGSLREVRVITFRASNCFSPPIAARPGTR